MAEIFPFNAWRYNPAQVALSDVVTQPYDKITPAMQEHYYQASPYNIVRIILGKGSPSDNEHENVYTRAAASWQQWKRERILIQHPEPGIYLYSQSFQITRSVGAPLPASHRAEKKADRVAGEFHERRGFIALGKIHDYEDGIVYRHEQTLAKPKQDRLNLLRATRAHFGQLFMLYSDPQKLETALEPQGSPEIEVVDEYGVKHRVWKIADAAAIARVTRNMAEKKLIIADGHHRYETALAYRNERRTEAGRMIPEAPYERVMMTFFNTEAPGLHILATHRVAFGLQSFNSSEMLAKAEKYFAVKKLSAQTAESAISELQRLGDDKVAFIAAVNEGMFLLREKPAGRGQLSGFSAEERRLNVVQLHKLLLEDVLGISAENIRNQQNIKYVRHAGDALAEVRGGANVAFLLTPVPVCRMAEIALAGNVMPQKSTDFYPKLLSGLTMYALD